jgi:hypothetical protein
MNQEPVPLVRSRLKMLSITLAEAPATAPVAQSTPGSVVLLRYSLIATTRRLTFDIHYQAPATIWTGDDDGDYPKFTAGNGYEVISRSRMDIQTERLWLLGAKHSTDPRSGTMVFSADAKRDRAMAHFTQALDEWAASLGGAAVNVAAPAPVAQDQPTERDEQMAELLRSACAIADRQGAGTHWQRFGDSIRALGLNGITARTYQVLPSDHESLSAAPAPVAHDREPMTERDHFDFARWQQRLGDLADAYYEAGSTAPARQRARAALMLHAVDCATGWRARSQAAQTTPAPVEQPDIATAVAAERERCARIADDMDHSTDGAIARHIRQEGGAA